MQTLRQCIGGVYKHRTTIQICTSRHCWQHIYFQDTRRSIFFSTEVIVVRHGETDWNRELRVQGVTNTPLNEKGHLQAQACAIALEKYLQNQMTTTTTTTTTTMTTSYLSSPPFIQIYSSPLQRAKYTAQAIANVLLVPTSSSLSSTPIVSTTPALQEWNLGVLEGLKREEASREFPDDWKIFSQWADPMVSWKDARQMLRGGGESMEQVRSRSVDFLHHVRATTMTTMEQTVDPSSPIILIFVTHGGVLGQLLRHVVGGPSTRTHITNETTLAMEEMEKSSSTTMSNNYSRPENACITRFLIETTEGDNTHHWKILSWADTTHLTGELAPISANYDQRN